MSHTLGPMWADRDNVWADVPEWQDPDEPGHHVIASTYGPEPMRNDNARFFAVAPDLLEVCEAVVELAALGAGVEDWMIQELGEKAATTVAKAKGE